MSYKNLVGPPNWYALVKSCITILCPVSPTSLEIFVVYEVYEILT